MRLKGKVALISGGALGMGASHAKAIVAEGGKVVIGDILDDEGRALVSELGGSARFCHLDVRNKDDWNNCVVTAEQEFGALNTLVNNAGIFKMASLEETTDEGWDLMMDINVRGLFLGMQVSAPALRRAGSGAIINISSTGGLRGYPDAFAYGTSKWAVRGMTKMAAADLAPYGIRVHSIHPGLVKTRMTEGFDNYSKIPLKRGGMPEEISHLVVYLASDESSYSTGGEFVIDGGETTTALGTNK